MSRNQPVYPFFEEILWRAVGVLGSLILRLLFSTIRTREIGRENRNAAGKWVRVHWFTLSGTTDYWAIAGITGMRMCAC